MPTPNQSPAPEHTPLPWIIRDIKDPLKFTIDGTENDWPSDPVCWFGANRTPQENVANAALIVRALPAAVEALDRALRAQEGLECSCQPARKDDDGNPVQADRCLQCELKAALRALKPE